MADIPASEIAEIRARHERIAADQAVEPSYAYMQLADALQAHADRATLLAEVERLTAQLANCREATVEGAVAEIAAERQRQIEKEEWTPKHDDEHGDGELAKAAACYALGKVTVTNIGGDKIHIWPWADYEWKPKDERRNLIRAAALLVDEIERLDRALNTGERHGPR